jgi:hemoglobin
MKVTEFDRLGGFSRIRLMVTDFYDRILDAEELHPYFASVDMRRLVDHQTKFFSTVLGGPASFTDEQLARAHARLGIEAGHFHLMADLFRETLEDHGLENPVVDRLVAHILALEPHIVGDSA